MAFHALADYQNHVIGWLQWEQSSLGDGAVVRFPRICMSSGECRVKSLNMSQLPLRRIRSRAGIRDVQLHDLRHTFARHAVLRGIPLPVVSRMLGHKRPSMTLRYAHVGDRETEAAAECIGTAISRALGGRDASSSD